MDILAILNVGSNLMFSMGIIFVLVFTLFYIRQRLSDYDNKINSMFQLVTKMASEIRKIKTPLPPIPENDVLPGFKTENLKLVNVDINEEYDDSEDEVEEDSEIDSEDQDNIDDLNETMENEYDNDDKSNLDEILQDDMMIDNTSENDVETDTRIEDELNNSEEQGEEINDEENKDEEENERKKAQNEADDIKQVRVVEIDNTLDNRVKDIRFQILKN